MFRKRETGAWFRCYSCNVPVLVNAERGGEFVARNIDGTFHVCGKYPKRINGPIAMAAQPKRLEYVQQPIA